MADFPGKAAFPAAPDKLPDIRQKEIANRNKIKHFF
jgi:hypothetical protein